MSTTTALLSRWFDDGTAPGANHMIVVGDQFDYEDFPVYIRPGEDAAEVLAREAARELQMVMEVYCPSMDKEAQLHEVRTFHLGTPDRNGAGRRRAGALRVSPGGRRTGQWNCVLRHGQESSTAEMVASRSGPKALVS